MQPVRIACVSYLNTVPLIAGLDKLAGVELVPTVPARIAGMVRAGEADVGLCSIVDAVGRGSGMEDGDGASDDLSILPVGMIGCDGPTMTVRLNSSLPLERITELHADTDSHTSVVLCRVLLDRLFGVRPRMVGLDASGGVWRTNPASGVVGSPECVLLIGDKVVTNAPPAEHYPHQLDLGEAWRDLTGLPFVYAAWMCRADRAASPAIRTAAAVLDRQRRHNATRLGWLVDRHAGAHGWPIERARHYLGELLRYEVNPRAREAVDRFMAEASRLGLLPDRAVRWTDTGAAMLL
jgi:chorismate dehydratase